MSASVVTTSRLTNTRADNRGIGRRFRRGLARTGALALLLGAGSGVFQARPDLFEALLTSLIITLLGMLGTGPEAISPWLALPVSVPAPAIALVSMALVGLLSGVVAGLALRGTRGLLRLMVAVLALLIGLVSAEIAQGILLGLPPAASLAQSNDGLEAIQLALGTLGAMLGIRLGRRQRVPRQRPMPQPAQQRTPAPRASQTARRQPVNTSVPHVALTDRVRQSLDAIDWQSVRHPAVRLPGLSLPDLSITARRLRIGRRASVRRRARANSTHVQNHNVHLGQEVTSTCPYCLEEVKPNDPRGRVVCDICGTPHHRDCWSITGKCQVPHLQD